MSPEPSDPASGFAHAAPRSPLARLLDLYRPAPARPPIQDPNQVDERLHHYRWRMFAGMFFGYAILYFCRKNISTALPVMARDLHYNNVRMGLIGTSLYVTYGLGKFLNGLLADRANIRRFLATALLISGAVNLLFGSLSGLLALALCWGLNGWFQSMGFPPIARGMTLWFPARGRATRWAFWTCSHQAGTAAIMALCAWILTWGTWRACFQIPGVLCFAFGLVLLYLLADTPQSLGLPAEVPFTTDAEPDEDLDYRTALVRHVLKNRNVWVIGFIDLFVYIMRYGTLDWTTKFMIEAKGYTVADAAFRAGLMPLSGVAGVLVSGFVADVVFRSRYRVVNSVFLLLLIGFMYAFYAVGQGHPVLDLVCLAGIGFFVEGPQSILGGVGAIDAGGSARVASAAAGLVGILAYVGASLSGVGTGYFIDKYQWGGAFGFWIACAVLGLGLCLLAWREPR